MTDDEAPDDPEPEDFPDFGGMEHGGDIGQLGLTIHRGILRDGGSDHEAFVITAAFFAGMIHGKQAAFDDENS